MKTWKKATALILALGMTFAMAACGDKGESEAQKEENFIGDIGGVSETYVGTVSTQSYTTANDAAAAYVQEEVVGSKTATVVNTETKATYENEQIDTLNLPAEVSEGALSVEEMEVEYTETEAVAYMSAGNSGTKTVKVYVIKYATDWKYYTPLPETGATISKSYYDSVFNYEKYENCTYSMTMEMDFDMEVSEGGYSMSMGIGMEMTQFIKFTENAIYLEATSTFSMSAEGESGSGTEELAAYMEKTEDGIVCYVKSDELTDGEWAAGDLIQVGFESLEELTPFYDQYLDYTYFTKTDYGFEVNEENAEKVILQALAQEDGFEQALSMFQSGMDLDMFIKYYVSDGVLSGMREDATMSIDISEDGAHVEGDMEIFAEVSCKDYGTTTVEKPF